MARKLLLIFLFVSLITLWDSILYSQQTGQEERWRVVKEDGVICHIVVKGDTLWDISAHYFGNPFLWPKLWQQNQYITNPHLIYPGYKIKLTEIKRKPAVAKKPKKAALPAPPPSEELPAIPVIEKKKKALPVVPKKIRITYTAKGNYMSFISSEEIKPAGFVRRGADKSFFMGDRTLVYLTDEGGTGLETGTIVYAYKKPKPITHPLTKRFVGHLIKIVGSITILDYKEGFYEGYVDRAFEEFEDGIPVASFDFPSPEIVVVEEPPYVEGNIIASLSGHEELGLGDIVFLDKGSASGVERGYMLDIFRKGATIARLGSSEKRTSLPPQRIGKMIVVLTQELTCTAVITEASRPVHVGDRFTSSIY